MAAALPLRLETSSDRLPGPAASRERRRRALGEFAAAGLPTTRRESWRYTNLQPLSEEPLDFAPASPDAAAVAAAAELLQTAALGGAERRLVFVDGHVVSALGTLQTAADLRLADLDTEWARFEDRFAERIATDAHPLAALNTAFMQRGAWLHVPDGRRPTEPLHLVFIGSGRPGLAPQPRVVLELGRNSAATIVQHFIDAGDSAAWMNSVTQIDQAPGSRLELYRLQEHGYRQTHTALITATLAADAELVLGLMDLGGKLVRNDVEVALREPGARAELFGLLLAASGQHVDDHMRIDHVAPETRSDEAFRGIIGHRGRGVFNGKVVVHRHAQRIEARQSSDNLLLSDQAEIDTKPELEIYADDVKCSHGTTVGELDTEQLFYLRSRGVGEREARELLTAAFAAAVVERISDATLREHVAARVAARLRTVTEVSA